MEHNRSSLLGARRTLWIAGLLALLILVSMIKATPVLAQDVGPRHTDPAWQAQYWNNPTLNGQPALVRTDPSINFDWGFGSPGPGIGVDNFSARWTRYIDVTPGNYRFTATADDGIRVWVDGQLIIDAWKVQPPTTYSATLYLGPGHHLVVVEYFEQYEGAVAKVSWQLVQPTDPGPGTGPWRGEYFNNVTLSGSPVLVRQEPAVDFNWGVGSPSPLVNVDHFSARWTRNVDLPAGNYRFRMVVDDGGRLFVNGHTLIDAWKEQAPTVYTGDIYLPGGSITVQMEYFERTGSAVAQLTWNRIDGQQPPISEWKGEYWNNPSLSGTPVLVRNESFIDFRWGAGSPAPELLGTDRFSARWTRQLDLPSGWYKFSMTVDDGGRLYLNGRLVIDAWRDQAATTYESSFYHAGGALDVRMDYYENTGAAEARLLWERLGSAPPGPTPAPTPTPAPGTGAVIVDNRDSGFQRGGNASGWNAAAEGYNGHLYWTRNNARTQSGYNWGRWYPTLNPGRYEVFVYIPDRYTTTSGARYWVSHAGGYTLRVVNQSANGGRWVSLGTYRFTGGREDYVSLADVTYEPYLSRLIAWDAVKWEPR
jgi:hypothetical protein